MQKVFTFIGIVSILVLLFVGYKFYTEKNLAVSTIQNLTAQAFTKDKEIKKWKDSTGATLVLVRATRVEKKMADVVWAGKIDSLAREWKVKERQIRGQQTLSIVIADTMKPATVYNSPKDTNCSKPNKWGFTRGDGKWTSIVGEGIAIGNQITDLKVGYFIKDSVQLTFIEKHPLFRPIQSSIGIKLSNPQATLLSSTTYVFYKRPKRWSLGVHVGIGVDTDIKIVKYAGIGLDYAIIQW